MPSEENDHAQEGRGQRAQDRRERVDPPSWRPVPDPTELTTRALYREVAALREIIEEKIEALSLLFGEKFDSVDRQLTLVENQRVEQKQDTKTAVDAALSAQKEAVREQTTAFQLATAKSEATLKEQLTQITITFTTALSGITTQLDDIKARVTILEATRIGIVENQTVTRNLRNDIVPWLVAGLLLVGTIITVAVAFSGSKP
jgi:hypothetical protein